MNEFNILSVSQLNNEINGLIERTFSFFWVEGEVSNLRQPSSGHAYFTLKDPSSQIRAVMFKRSLQGSPFRLQDGQNLICFGTLNVYTTRGEYQVIVERAEPAGTGSLHFAFEQLKKKLEAEGLFDISKKKAIPANPARIGVITSPTGAAIRDILKVLSERRVNSDILIYPVSVQGETAAGEIVRAIDHMNEIPGIDVIILGRGGGSIEDLWPFNNEELVRAIAASDIPIISAVGHETDFTLSDFAADLRAATPSAAAEMAAESGLALIESLGHKDKRLFLAIRSRLTGWRSTLGSEIKSLKSPSRKIGEAKMRLDEISWKLELLMAEKVKTKRFQLAGIAGKLDALSPLSALYRGYSIATIPETGKAIRSTEGFKKGDNFNLRLHRGEMTCEVRKVIS